MWKCRPFGRAVTRRDPASPDAGPGRQAPGGPAAAGSRRGPPVLLARRDLLARRVRIARRDRIARRGSRSAAPARQRRRGRGRPGLGRRGHRLQAHRRPVRRRQPGFGRLGHEELVHRLPGNEGARPAQVLQQPVALLPEGQPHVLPGHPRVIDHDRAVFPPADMHDLSGLGHNSLISVRNGELVHRSSPDAWPAKSRPFRAAFAGHLTWIVPSMRTIRFSAKPCVPTGSALHPPHGCAPACPVSAPLAGHAVYAKRSA